MFINSFYQHRVNISNVYFTVVSGKESAEKEIVLQETKAGEAVFDTFLGYFYTGFLNISPETAPDILRLADKYDATVKQNCIDYMIATLNKGNLDKALDWIPVCHQIKADDVLERCYVIVCFNFEKAVGMPGWLLLSLQDILNILKRSDIIVKSEYDIYIAVKNWMSSQAKCETKTMKSLFAEVQFQNMNTLELEQVEQSSLEAGNASECLTQHVQKAFRYLAMKAENRKSEQVGISRLYTKDTTLQSVVFNDRSTSVTPRYRNRTDITGLYNWTLSYLVNNSDKSVRFRVVVPKISRVVGRYGGGFGSYTGYATTSTYNSTKQKAKQPDTCTLSSEIKGKVDIKMMIFPQNSQGIIISAATTWLNRAMPTWDVESFIDFTVKDIDCEPKAAMGLVSFEMK